jgi:osmotically-inducible protein OsmY
MRQFILAIIVTAGLTGCSNWNRATPAPLDNMATTAEVKKNLLSDSLTGIDVDTSDGVVTLSGHLPTRAARRNALHDASKVAGVRRVVDKIVVP